MKKRDKKLKKKWLDTIIVLVSMVVFSLLIDQVFISYHNVLNQNFEELLYTNLTSYADTQRLDTLNYNESIMDTLEAMEVLVQSEDLDPEGDAFQNYLAAYNEKNGDVQINYMSIENLEATLDAPGSQAEDGHILDQLKSGQSVVSQIRHSVRLNGYFYSIAVPVQRQNQVIGVLRSTSNAKELLVTEYGSDQIAVLQQYVVMTDGQVVTVDDEQAIKDTTIYEGLAQYDLSEAAKSQLKNALESGNTTALELGDSLKTGVFLTCTGLPDNGWHIVNIVKADAILKYSDIIMGQTVFMVCLILGILLIAAIFIRVFISRTRKKEKLMAQQYDLLEQFSDTVLFQYDYKKDYAQISANASDRFEIDDLKCEQYLQKDKKFLPIHPDDRQMFVEALRHPKHDAQVQRLEFRLQDKELRYHWWSYQYQYIFDKDEPVRCVGKCTDISHQKERESQLLEKTTTDGLTGLLNKAAAQQEVRDMIDNDEPGILFLLDLDNFKSINDNYGHAVGDQVLQKFASIMKQFFRSRDILGRIGGDEFMIYLRGSDNKDLALEKARLILRSCQRYTEKSGYQLGASIGMAVFPADGDSYEELFTVADQAMYKIKRDGKSSYGFSGE